MSALTGSRSPCGISAVRFSNSATYCAAKTLDTRSLCCSAESGRRPEPAEALRVPLRDPRPKQATGTVGRLPTCPHDSAGGSDQIERAALASIAVAWATAARKDCYPDRRARLNLQLRTGGRPERRSCRCPYAFQGQESSRHNTAISRWHRVCVRLGQNCGKVAAWPRRPSW